MVKIMDTDKVREKYNNIIFEGFNNVLTSVLENTETITEDDMKIVKIITNGHCKILDDIDKYLYEFK